MTSEFIDNINNPESSIAMDLSHPDRPLLIAFGGIAGKMSIPPFEFFNLTANLDVNKIYIRDLRQTWYHSGIQGISDSIDDTAAYLKRKVIESGSNRVAVFGNSMGGYAAILFGVLIQSDIVHAFVPQTFIDDVNYVRNKQRLLLTQSNYSNEYFDLKEVMESHNCKVDINIYYDPRNELRKKHAEHLRHLKNIKLHPYRDGKHSLVRQFRESGELIKIIASSFCIAPGTIDGMPDNPFILR